MARSSKAAPAAPEPVPARSGRGDPGGLPDSLESIRAQCRALVRRRALMAAAVSFVPIPGVDLITDITVLVNLLPEINARFGLDDAQVERLAPARKAIAYRLMVSAGGALARRLTTTALVGTVLRRAGLRLGVMEASRFVPLVGQGAAALIAYFALTQLAYRHIDECAVLAGQIHDTPA